MSYPRKEWLVRITLNHENAQRLRSELTAIRLKLEKVPVDQGGLTGADMRQMLNAIHELRGLLADPSEDFDYIE